MAEGGAKKDKTKKIQSVSNFNYRTLGDDISVSNFTNPWTFYGLFSKDDMFVNNWLRQENLLPAEYDCIKCSKTCRICDRKDTQGSQSLNTLFSPIRTSANSIQTRDVLQFIRKYLEKNSLHLCSVNAGISYNTTAVFWAKQLRQLFTQYVFNNMFSMTFDGEVELDESPFGRKCKYHKGKDTGCKVWIFGIVERSTNRLILYPVDRRNKQTLIPLIKKHVKPGATIFSDGWTAYLAVNDEGFSHFTVSHKTTFRQKSNGFLPPTLYMKDDNCAKDNKNNYVLVFLCQLVKAKIF